MIKNLGVYIYISQLLVVNGCLLYIYTYFNINKYLYLYLYSICMNFLFIYTSRNLNGIQYYSRGRGVHLQLLDIWQTQAHDLPCARRWIRIWTGAFLHKGKPSLGLPLVIRCPMNFHYDPPKRGASPAEWDERGKLAVPGLMEWYFIMSGWIVVLPDISLWLRCVSLVGPSDPRSEVGRRSSWAFWFMISPEIWDVRRGFKTMDTAAVSKHGITESPP